MTMEANSTALTQGLVKRSQAAAVKYMQVLTACRVSLTYQLLVQRFPTHPRGQRTDDS